MKGLKMKLKIEKEKLEGKGYDDIAYLILQEKGKKMKTADLFQTICDILEFDEKAYDDQIADFFTLLTTEKRFVQLEKGYWDLREKHSLKISLKNIEEDSDEIIDEEDIDECESDDLYYDEKQDTEDDDNEDDLKDLVIVDEDEDVNHDL